MDMKIRPIADKVLVERLDPREKSSGGIIIPDVAKEQPQEGKIMEVGPGRMGKKGKREAIPVKREDRILFASYAGTDVDVAGGEYVILAEDDIIGIVE
jgi:chaperonin GroES